MSIVWNGSLLDKLESLRLFNMLCPTCQQGQCVVANLSRKYEAVLKGIISERTFCWLPS